MSSNDRRLIDRTRYKLGTARCPRARYLGYYAGETGYGLTRRGESLPLATGSAVHDGLARLTEHLKTRDRVPTAAEVRLIVSLVVAAYLARVEAKGFTGTLTSEETRETITEQATLIAGLLWALWVRFIPWLHDTYQVISVEEEREPYPLDSQHALMIKTDLLARRRTGKSLAYFECKTTGWQRDSWVEQWETDPQLGIGTLGLRDDVSELYIIGLHKGRRQREYGDLTGRKKQFSPLCYGYKREGNPPLAMDQWLPAYQWTDEHGETKRATRAHRRTGVWELEHSDDPTWQAYKANDPELTPVEYWVRTLPTSVLDDVCFLLGPMNRQDEQLKTTLKNMRGEERRWTQALWALYAVQQHGHEWGDPVFMDTLDEWIPCSWACRPFGKEHECEFVPLCHKHSGWDDPIGSGHYQPRLPHHKPELDQAVERGLITANAAPVEEEE